MLEGSRRPFLVFLVTFLGLAGSGGLGPALRADSYPRQPGLDVLHYVFELTLSDDRPGVEGRTRIRVRFLQEAREVAFDLASVRDGKGMQVSSVERDGRALPFVHEADRLKVALDPGAPAGSETTLVVRYGGVPAEGFYIGPNKHGDRVFFSDSWPNKGRQWAPSLDHPYDKATGEIVVTAPAAYQVVANGLLADEEDLPGGLRRTRWRQAIPISTWLYALGVARYAVHHAGSAAEVPLQSWVFPQDRAAVMPAFEVPARAAAEFFAARIGPYPYEKLANVQATGFKGGIEHASAIFYDENTVTARPITSLVAHEVAHQWWGNSVTEADWNEVWLSEGFATYFAHLFTEHDEGRDAFADGLRRSRDQVLELERKLPETPVIHRGLQDMEKVLNGLVYQKGGWTLHMLRGQVGTEAFWTGIREHYRRHAHGHATTEDLRLTMEAASGQKLGWFFDQWLRRSGVPRLEGTWTHRTDRKQLEVTLRQTQPGEAYRLSVDLGPVFGPASVGRAGDAGAPDAIAPRPLRAEMDGREQTFRFDLERAPREVVLDPEVRLLGDLVPLRRR